MNTLRRRRVSGEEEEVVTKRRRGIPLITEVERKLQDIIGRVGDKGKNSSIESNLEGLCNLLQDDLDKYRTNIIDILVGCVIYLPEKVTVYSTLVGLLNAKNFNFGGDVVEKVIAQQQEILDAENYEQAMNIALFLCDLGNCRVLTLQSIGEYLESFVSAAFEEDVPQVRTDWFIYTVLHCLPWIGAELKDKANEQLENIFEGVGKYLEARKRDHIQILQVWLGGGSPHEQEDYLDCLWAQIGVLQKADWKEKHIPRHYIGFDAVLQDALQHNLPSFSAPSHKPSSKYPFPYVVFRLFDYADCPEDSSVLPGAHSIERFLIEEELTWIIRKNQFNRKNCARELLEYAHEFPSVAMGYMIFEVIFGHLFRLPHSPQPAVFYGALLLELCRLQASTYPQILVQSVELLYQRADTMQPSCVDRFVDWFSFHLSNFQFRYSWADWKDCLEKETWSGCLIFSREVLEKCRRLGTFEKITQAVPAEFAKVLPPRPNIRYMLDDEAEAGYERAQTFSQMFQERQPAEAFTAELKTDEETGYNIEEFGIFFSVMLKMASKTYSHNFAALSKYQNTLKTICDFSERFQEKLLDTLYDCWKTNQQMMMILIDKLLKMQVLDCGMVINWLFDEQMRHEQDRQWLFEVLNMALEKLSSHVVTIEKDYKALKERVEAAEIQRNKREEGIDGVPAADEEEMDDESRAKDIEDLEIQRDKFESLADFQKSLFFDVFQKFTTQLTDLKVNNEAEGIEFHTPAYNWLRGRFQQVFIWHNDVVWKFTESLSEELFTDDTDAHVNEVFRQFLSLKL
ncbi:unnamed protein product [Caenorhabditis auriculariae]|uniref:Nuclear cap-binding protein subunit 1 n=1 Tax=Caenorhabditis auriculariae TaxID=2777116 RepID=A0A8S1GS70_9PELO|nr:unnamed protein product [Caenorhabditis auriculariae]